METSEKIEREMEKVQNQMNKINDWLDSAMKALPKIEQLEQTVKQKAEDKQDAKS